MFNYVDSSFSLFGLDITYYAVCIMTGVILALVLGVIEGKKLGIWPEDIYTGICIILPCCIVGARLWYVLFTLDEGWTFRKIIGLEGGLAGLAIQGAIIVAAITIFFYCRWKKLDLYRILDLVAPGFFIGQICGRWGNFFNHELYGPKVQNVELFQKLLPEFITDNMYISGAFRHPTFLYESALNLVGFILILVARRKFKKVRCGDFVGFYLVWYGAVRIFTESLRMNSGANEVLKIGPIPVSLALSVLFIIGGIAFLVLKRFFGPKKYYHEALKEVKENRLDVVLFDLDGTLLDTKNLIFRSFIHTFDKFRPEHNLTDEELNSFFGPTLHQTFSRYSNDEKEIKEMIDYYREFNIANHDTMVKAFDGVKEMVRTLHNKGYMLGVVSSKKDDLVKHGLELVGIDKMFDIVIGADMVSAHKPAPNGILMALKKLEEIKNTKAEALANNKKAKIINFILGKKEPSKIDISKACYVGDTLNDMLAAKAAGVKAIAVLYGDNAEAMQEADPDYAICKPAELLRICVE